MKVEIISRETIKPSFPTPKSLKNFKLSAIDQLVPPVYSSLISFYFSNDNVCFSDRSQQLKKSLSESLTLYYPFAGKLKDNIMIDCNDYGAFYIEARVDCLMSNFLKKPNEDELALLIATNVESTEAIRGGFFTLIQVSSFNCGGLAIGLSISHKLGDGITFSTFMKCWAAKTLLGSGAKVVVPLYNAAALFPPVKFPPSNHYINFEKEKLSKRRLVFEASKITALKVATSNLTMDRPSRIEAIIALIWKCALKAARSNSSSSRPSMLMLAMNLRQRTSPPLPSNSVGNLTGSCIAQKDGSKVELQGLVHELREKIKFSSKIYEKLLSEEDPSQVMIIRKEQACMMIRPNIDFYTCSVLCNMSWYDIDFGWGKPVWVMIQAANTKGFVLMDTRKGDGSIECWLTLGKEEMYLFEHDPELLAYASLSPNVLDTVHTFKSKNFSSL